MNAVATVRPTPALALIPQNVGEALQIANMMAQGKVGVPVALQKSPADCLAVVEQAMRWAMSPFAVAQEVSVIQGKMMFSGKIVAAAVHTSGVLDGRLSYQYQGSDADLSVTVSGQLRGESEARTVTVRLADAKTNNQHWAKSPQQMLAYHAARVWARRHAPEVMLGVYAPEEFDEPQHEPRHVDATLVRSEPHIVTCWRIYSRDGSAKELNGADAYMAEWRMRIAAVERAAKLSPAQKADTLQRMAEANAGALIAIEAEGHSDVVEGVRQMLDLAIARHQPELEAAE